MHKNNRSIISIAIIIQAARFEFWIHCNPFYYGPYGPSTPSIIVWFENNAWYGILLININKITYKLSNRGVQPDLVPDQPIQPGQPSPKTGRPDTADNQRRVSIPKTRFQRVGWQVWAQKKMIFNRPDCMYTGKVVVLHRWVCFAGVLVRSVKIWPYLFEIYRDLIEIRRDLVKIRPDLFKIHRDLIEIQWDLIKIRPNLFKICRDLFEISLDLIKFGPISTKFSGFQQNLT